MRNLLFVAPEPAPADPGDVVAALLDARALVQLAWTQGEAVTIIDGCLRCYCAVAAITACSPSTQIRDAAMTAMRIATPARYHSIPEFNDAARTVGEVADMFTRAAGYARNIAA